MKYLLKEKGYVETQHEDKKHSDILERVYEFNGVDYVCLKGEFTSRGVINWFYKISDFRLENNVLYIPEYLPNPALKLKNLEIDNKLFGYSVDTKKELNYQAKTRKANIIFGKNGNGYTTTKIALPVPWIEKINLTPENREVIIKLENNEIIIKKEA